MNTVRKRLMLVLTVLSVAFLATVLAWLRVQSRTADLIFASSSRDKSGAVEKILQVNTQDLVSLADDYANSAEVAQTLDSGNNVWASTRLPQTLHVYRADAVWLFRASGQVQFFLAPPKSQLAGVRLSLAELRRMASMPGTHTSFVLAPRGVVELAIRPVKSPAPGSPTIGYLAVGRAWDGTFLNNIAVVSGCGVKVQPIATHRKLFADPETLALRTLDDPSGNPVATLRLTGDMSVAEVVHGASESALGLFLAFAVGVLGFLYMGLVRWVSRPLASISKALVAQDAAGLSDLVRDRSEFGRMATLVCDFFQQKGLLVAEIADRRRAEEELRAARAELEVRVQERTAELMHANAAMREEVNERIRAVDALRATEAKYRGIVENAVEGIFQTTPEGIVLQANPAFARILGYETVAELLGSDKNPRRMPYVQLDRMEQFKRIIEQLDVVHDFEVEMFRKTGETAWLSINARVVRGDECEALYYEGTIEDVSERKRSECEIMRLNSTLEDRINRMVALRRVDIAISSSHDLSATLQIFLSEVTSQLGVDAAAVLLCDQNTLRLKYGGNRGFYTNALRHTHLSLGAGQAGKAALERRKIHIPNLALQSDTFTESPAFKQEAFVAYIAVPLVAKGQVKGVLEVFHRSQIETNHEWMDFLDALAGLAAIAIDNASLFEGLQRSNEELTLAYDATIEGWSRALDLRDKETEGHSRRVTEMAIRLGMNLGMTDAELVQVRRGALLHDIGKMGIPDQILLKPTPLDEDEWRIMRLHPVYAYEMLYPVEFLRPALDIPYCHHEKWDGTGYPRKLKGEQIPIAARIFAMVDVWDALRSDRPYRKSWSEEKVLEHIQALSGKHFDPTVAEAFVNMMRDSQSRFSVLSGLPKAA